MTDILIVEDNEELGALIRDFLVRDCPRRLYGHLENNR